MPISDEPYVSVAEIKHDQLERITCVRPTAYTVPVPILLVTDRMDSIPEHLHDIPSRDVVDGQLWIIERDLVIVRMEAGPVDHGIILGCAIREGCKHSPLPGRGPGRP